MVRSGGVRGGVLGDVTPAAAPGSSGDGRRSAACRRPRAVAGPGRTRPPDRAAAMTADRVRRATSGAGECTVGGMWDYEYQTETNGK